MKLASNLFDFICIAGVENILLRTTIIGVILSFRDTAQEALHAVCFTIVLLLHDLKTISI